MENIFIKDFIKQIKVTKETIIKLKDSTLLSNDIGILTLSDLKIFIIYSQKLKESKIKNIEKCIKTTKNYLEINSLDTAFKLAIFEDKNLAKNFGEKITKNITLETCMDILKVFYPIPMEEKESYSVNNILNLSLEEERIENEENEALNDYNYSNVLDYIFDKYSKKEAGYFPLQHPTGNGKTFFLEKFLIRNLQEDFKELKHDRIIVITNSKVNLNEIYRNIAFKLNDNKKFEKYVLKVESITDIFSNIEFLNNTIVELQQDLEFYKNFPPNFINNFKNELKNIIILVEKDVTFGIMERIKDFIPRIKKEMFSVFSSKKNIALPKFLEKMYPMILEENLKKKIYIMTTDKFLYGFVGRKETTYFYEGEKSLIFIDEIDSAKQNFLKFIKTQRTLCADNIINIFNDRFNSFSSSGNNQLLNLIKRLDQVWRLKFKEENLFSAEEVLKINKEKEKLFEIVNDFVEKGKKLRKTYFTTKKYFELENPEKIDLWEDESNYFQNNGIKYYVNVNKKNCLITVNKNKETFSLNSLIRDLFSFCYGYFYYVLTRINNYHKLFLEEDEIEKEIISHFFFNEENQNQILNEYKNFFVKRLNKKSKKHYDISEEDKVISMKYSCFQIKEANPDYSYNEKVLISSQFMYTTPELMLYRMCKNNLVFGISATADIETCVGNFDLRFLKMNLRDNYYTLNHFEQAKLKKSLETINRFEKDIKRELNVFGKAGNFELGFKNVENLRNNDELYYRKLMRTLRTISQQIIGDEKTRENQIMYLEYSYMVIINFLLEKESRSLLFISNRLTQIPLLKQCLVEIKKILGKKIEPISFKELNAKGIDESFKNKTLVENDLMKDLSNPKKKTIIYTTFQSAGTGVNFKCYSQKFDKNSLIAIDSEIQKEINFPLEFKDIDEIAVENKTHLINFDESKNKVEMIYYSSLLLENNALSKEHRSFLLKGDIINFTGAYKTKYDYVENCVGKIIQAIGRCSRTKLRNKVRNIYIDEDGFEVLKRFEGRGRLFIEDINFILSEAKRVNLKERNASSFNKDLILKNYKIIETFEKEYLDEINKYNSIMRISNNEGAFNEPIYNLFCDFVKKYEDFRKYVLKYPTRSDSSPKNQAYFSIGEDISGYNILRKEDGSIKDLNFIAPYRDVSFEESRLKEIFAIPLLKNFCLKNIGIFEANKEIILPYVYQAIFKAMLGESIIKEIFSIYRIKLKDTDYMIREGIFEKFDDITENGIWIDYKNYNLEKMNSRDFFREIIESSVTRKRELINTKNKLFVINLIAGKRESKALGCFKIEELINGKNQVHPYENSEVVIINGILRYKKDGTGLEINNNLVKKLQKMLGECDERVLL